MDELWANNSVELCGSLAGAPRFSHESRGERYFVFPVETERLSGAADTVNVLARESLLRSIEPEDGLRLGVSGELRSFNNKSGIGSRLILNVFAKRLCLSARGDVNSVHLQGVICKEPNFRRTPLGREICDLMLAVARKYGRSDYLPCIVWGREAQEAALWRVGDAVNLIGRLQSRRYIKLDGQAREFRTAYEVSVSAVERA